MTELESITFRWNATFGHWEYQELRRDCQTGTRTYIERKDMPAKLVEFMRAAEGFHPGEPYPVRV